MLNMIDDDTLKDVNGGAGVANGNANDSKDTKDALCPKCKEVRTFKLYTGGRAICQRCGEEIFL